jgi:hypothetical protein
MKSVNNKKCDDTRYLYRSNEQHIVFFFCWRKVIVSLFLDEGNRQSNPTRLEQTDEQHLQIIPRIKQTPTDGMSFFLLLLRYDIFFIYVWSIDSRVISDDFEMLERWSVCIVNSESCSCFFSSYHRNQRKR